MNLNLKLEMFKKKETFSRKKDSEVNPDFYWRIVLYVAVFLILAGAAFGYYLFTQVNAEPDTADQAALSEVGTVKKDRIDKDLQYFTDRENTSKSLLAAPSPVVDPSL